MPEAPTPMSVVSLDQSERYMVMLLLHQSMHRMQISSEEVAGGAEFCYGIQPSTLRVWPLAQPFLLYDSISTLLSMLVRLAVRETAVPPVPLALPSAVPTRCALEHVTGRVGLRLLTTY